MEKKSVVAILDTNVLISAWILQTSIPGIILKRFRNGDFELITSNHQLDEIAEVVARPALKKYINLVEATSGIRFLRSGKVARILKPKQKKWDFPDEKDHFLLDLIDAEEPDFLVTGDKLLLQLVSIGDTNIVSPADFLQFI